MNLNNPVEGLIVCVVAFVLWCGACWLISRTKWWRTRSEPEPTEFINVSGHPVYRAPSIADRTVSSGLVAGLVKLVDEYGMAGVASTLDEMQRSYAVTEAESGPDMRDEWLRLYAEAHITLPEGQRDAPRD